MDNKKKNRSPLKNPLLIFLVISVIATVILNMVMLSLQTPKKQEISYSEFLTMLDENKVDEVILQSEQIVIYEKYDESQPITTPKTTEFMKMMGIDTDAVIEQAKENSRNVYYTGYIPDDRLLADLDSHGVKYSTPIQHNSPVLDFFLTWILPLVVIYLLFFILTRSMSKKIGGGGGIMGIGQSNAKMYNVENATGVTFADVAGQEEAKESLDEIVDYLHNPSKYLAIGAASRVRFWLHRREQVKHFLQRRLPVRRKCRFSRFPVRNLWKCLSASVRREFVTCFKQASAKSTLYYVYRRN